MMKRNEAEDYIYESYMKAQKTLNYNDEDRVKRHPELSRDIIVSLCRTPAYAVTGSKGKGSVCRMLSEILQTRYSTGMMTSPHVTSFNERFQVNSREISDEEFIKCMESVRMQFDELTLPDGQFISPIGIQTALALTYFNLKNTQVNVFECGKGVQFDDVKNVDYQIGIINTVFLEHTRELGKTLREIAENKAALIHSGLQCVFLAKQDAVVQDVMKKAAERHGVPLKCYGADFRAENVTLSENGTTFDAVIGNERYPQLCVPLLGEHQAENCVLALAAAKEMLGQLEMKLVREKLLQLEWPGRMEILSKKPLVILDACIHRESCTNVIRVLESMRIKEVIAVVCVPDDKDFAGVAEMINQLAKKVIITKTRNPHYRFSDIQINELSQRKMEVISTDCAADAVHRALKDDLPVVLLGTTSFVSEIKKEWREMNHE